VSFSHQASGIRRFGNGASQLSPLRPVLGNGDALIEVLRNALTFERVLHFLPQFICGQPIGRECDTQPVSNCRGARLIWAYVRRDQPNEESDYDVKNAQATEETRGSDMVAEGMMEVHTAHATSTPVKETSKALK